MRASPADQANHTLAGVVQRSLPASANIKLVEVNGERWALPASTMGGCTWCRAWWAGRQLRVGRAHPPRASRLPTACAFAAGHRNMARLIAQSAVQVSCHAR